MISPDCHSKSDTSDSFPETGALGQQQLPSIHTLFPELSNKWSVPNGSESFKDAMDIDYDRTPSREVGFRLCAMEDVLRVTQRNVVENRRPPSLSRYSPSGRRASLPRNSVRGSPTMLPALQAISLTRPTLLSPIPSYAEYRTAQLRRPRSSPVSPTEDRAWMRDDDGVIGHLNRATWGRSNSTEPGLYAATTLDDTRPPTASSSAQSTPPHHYASLSYASVPRVQRAGVSALDVQPLSNRASSSRYQCSYCTKRFSRPSSLKIHENSHTGAKPFQCPEPGCGRHFSVMSNMRRHQKTHKMSTPPQQFAALRNPASNHRLLDNQHHINDFPHPLMQDRAAGPSTSNSMPTELPPNMRSKPRSFTSPT